MKQFIKSQMKGVPDEQIEMVLSIVEKNPELFKKIAEEVQAAVASGKDQATASMEVMKKYEEELKKLQS